MVGSAAIKVLCLCVWVKSQDRNCYMSSSKKNFWSETPPNCNQNQIWQMKKDLNFPIVDGLTIFSQWSMNHEIIHKIYILKTLKDRVSWTLV